MSDAVEMPIPVPFFMDHEDGGRYYDVPREVADHIKAQDAEIIRLRAKLAEAQPKRFVSPPGTFEIAELSDTIEVGGKVYVIYDELMDSIRRHSETHRALVEAEARGYRRGIEDAVTAVAPSPAPAERRDDGYLSWDEVTPIAYWISINGAPEVRDVSAWNAFFGAALSEKK